MTLSDKRNDVLGFACIEHKRRTPQDTPKDTLHTHNHTHIHARQCFTNRYALTHTNTHICAHTLTICEFLWLQSWIFVTTGIRHTLSHTMCVHPLRSSVHLPPSRIFSTLPLVQVVGQRDSGNGWLWTAGPLGWQRCARTVQDHAESMNYKLNRCGDGQRGTRTESKHAEDRQARARVPRGGGSDRPHAMTSVYPCMLYMSYKKIICHMSFSNIICRLILQKN